MITVKAKLSSKGQLVLPQEVREALGISEGDRIEFCITRSKEVWVFPRNRPADAIFGLGSETSSDMSEEERERLVSEAMASRGAPARFDQVA